MNIGIIGAGNVGTGLAKRLVQQGHEVMLSFSRDGRRLESTAASLGTRAGTVADAAHFAEVIVLATPYTSIAEAVGQMGTETGKVIWDCTNPLKPNLSGLLIGTSTSAGEELAKLIPWAKIVKAIPPFAEVLHAESVEIDGKKPAVFVCGDDARARADIGKLILDIGAEPVDAGPLQLARFVEPANMLLVALAYGSGFGAKIGFSLNQEKLRSETA